MNHTLTLGGCYRYATTWCWSPTITMSVVCVTYMYHVCTKNNCVDSISSIALRLACLGSESRTPVTLHPDAGSQPRFRDLLWQFFPARIWGKCGDFRPFSLFVLHSPLPQIKIVIRPFSQPFGVFGTIPITSDIKFRPCGAFQEISSLIISRPGIFLTVRESANNNTAVRQGT